MNPRWTFVAFALSACVPDSIDPVDQSPPVDEWDAKLAERVVDYNAALRIASLKLIGELPTLAEIKQVVAAPDKKSAYATLVRGYITSPKFARQMFRFWQDALKMGDTAELDSAPAFAAQLVVENRSFLGVLTATSGTCPTYTAATSQFTPGNCTNNAPVTVGLLTHPGVQKHFFGNLAFRRVRWVQETFACTKFPAEVSTAPIDVGGAQPYTGTFPFASIAGEVTGGRVDFRNTESVICANCHSNMNHIAPLFAYYDEAGRYSSTMVAPTPLPMAPAVKMSDYLPTGEGMAWRNGVPVTDMASLGKAMAADRAISECAIARVWNWAMDKQDIVDGLAKVPSATISTQVDAFIANDHKLRDAILAVFTSDDFVKF